MRRRKWTDRQVAYLIRHYADRDTEVLCQRLRRKPEQIYAKAQALGLRKPRDYSVRAGRIGAQHPKAIAHRFVKGQEPPNKGKRIEEFMSKEGIERSSRTRFQPGQLPHNTQPVVHERVSKDGYIYIKVSMTEKMVLKHRYVWEQANGPVPDGHCVAFRDGNRQNCELSNLYLLSRGDNARRRTQEETPEQRRIRVERCQASRNKSIRRDKIRLHWGLEPYGKLVKRW
jgi:hypothetical protein